MWFQNQLLTVRERMKNKQQVSDEELNEEINDKLNQLWSGMNNKRKQMVRNMTPNYSRRTDNISEINQSSTNFISENQILKIREKLANEVSSSKKKDVEIESLKGRIAELTNDKKMLVHELQQLYGNTQNININSSLLNESSIQQSQLSGYKNTASFENNPTPNTVINRKTKKPANKKYSTITQEPEETAFKKSKSKQNLQDLSKQRLIQLLRSTAQYREFVYYYDSHELSYLKRLQEQHRKNCDNKLSLKEKAQWGPTEILNEFQRINENQCLELSESHLQYFLSVMKQYYEAHFEDRIRKNKEEYENKLKKVQREAQNLIPYDLVQICKAKERQLTKMSEKGVRKNRIASFK